MTRASDVRRRSSSTTEGSINLSIKVARIFNTYGPRMHPNDGRVISNFIVRALKNQPITIFGEGRQTRSFCYVDDLIEAFIRLMGTSESFTGPVNLGNPDEFTILQLAELVIELTNSSSKLVNRPLPPDDPQQRQPDITLAKAELDWAPVTPLRDGLIKTVSYFEQLVSDGLGIVRSMMQGTVSCPLPYYSR